MRDAHDVVKAMMRTEKGSVTYLPLNKYLFLVDRRSNKVQIKKAVEEIYKVKVKAVNTSIVRGKAKRVRYETGRTSDWKKAIVTLREGSKIEVT